MYLSPNEQFNSTTTRELNGKIQYQNEDRAKNENKEFAKIMKIQQHKKYFEDKIKKLIIKENMEEKNRIKKKSKAFQQYTEVNIIYKYRGVITHLHSIFKFIRFYIIFCV